VLLPLFTVVGMGRCEEDWYAADNKLRVTPRGSRKKPNAGRKPTGRLSTAVLYRGLDKNGMVGAWHGHGHGKCESDTAALCKSNGKYTFYTLSGTAWHEERHGHEMGVACARHAMCESAFTVLTALQAGYSAQQVWINCGAGCYVLCSLSKIQTNLNSAASTPPSFSPPKVLVALRKSHCNSVCNNNDKNPGGSVEDLYRSICIRLVYSA